MLIRTGWQQNGGRLMKPRTVFNCPDEREVVVGREYLCVCACVCRGRVWKEEEKAGVCVYTYTLYLETLQSTWPGHDFVYLHSPAGAERGQHWHYSLQPRC